MSEVTNLDFEVMKSSEIKNSQLVEIEKKKWPPNEDDITNIAVAALNQSQDKDVKVLVYWDNPALMIFDPFHFGNTKYINKKYEHNERSVEVIIGKED